MEASRDQRRKEREEEGGIEDERWSSHQKQKFKV